MAEFSQHERNLLKSIPDNSPMRTSLSLLREATEKIWANDAPRIIQGYTDHGISHLERIAERAVSLLLANHGKKLSVDEMYLLLAGIYLHDIGMQCDIILHSEIKKLAETEFGARFDIEFTKQRSNDYSVEAQKAIRKNHHYLSIAWLVYAKRTGATVLGPAARSVPNHLVRDLTDVCKYHTSLSIDDCPEKFERGQSDRKRMVAALLRFADELDIAANRVSLETVQNFNLDPSNTVYWWLHNRTHITFPTTNLVMLEIWMHPEDTSQYSAVVKSTFIDKFRQKNAPVVRVLTEKSIFIQIHDKSDVKSSDNEDIFPPGIGEALEVMSGRQRQFTPSGENPSKQANAERKTATIKDNLIEAARGLRNHLTGIEQLLADPDVRPMDCDRIIGNLESAQKAIQEIYELLSAPAIEPDLLVAASEFRALRHRLNQSIGQLKTDLFQFRNSCPPRHPATQEQRKVFHRRSVELQHWFTVFERTLPSDSIINSTLQATVSTPDAVVVNAPTQPTVFPEVPPASLPVESLQLAKLLSRVNALHTHQDRTHVIGLLKSKFKIAAVPRHNSNDLYDLLGIVTTCLEYDDGLDYLVNILRQIDGDSLPLRKVTEYMVASKTSHGLT